MTDYGRRGPQAGPSMEPAGVYRAASAQAPGVRQPAVGRKTRKGTVLLAMFAALGVAAAVVATIVLLQANGTPLPGIPALVTSTEPQTAEAAKAAAQRAMDRAVGGDAGGSWDLLSDRGKSMISRSDYVRYATECPGVRGMSAETSDIRLETPTKAVAIVKVLGFTVSLTMLYEHAAWRWEPSAEQVTAWTKPIDKRIAADKASGSCGN